MPQRPNTPVSCRVCNKEWLVTPQHARTHKGYCAEHRLAGSHATVRERGSPLKAPPNRICSVCQRPFHAKPAVIAAGGALTCSNRCRGAAMQVEGAIPDSDLDLAYMAGIVDGEGTITVVRTLNPKTGNRGSHPRFLVANTSDDLMFWLREKFGGTLSEPRPTRKENHKSLRVWYIGSDQAVALCRALLPYLRVKHRHAEIILALATLPYEYGPGRAGRRVAPEAAAAREPLLAELVQLNHRGRSAAMLPDDDPAPGAEPGGREA